MTEKNNLVEDAFLQMKNLEEAVAKNAKGILAATMGQEIKELVKESLSEADEDDDDETEVTNMDMSSDDEMSDDEDSNEMGLDMSSDDEMSDDEESDEMGFDMSSDFEDDDEVVDLTNASDEEILKVFKSMGEDDGIIVKKDDNMLHLEDTNEDVEYMVDLGEGEEDMEEGVEMEMEMEEDMEMDETIVNPDYSDDEENEGIVYEIETDDEMEESMDEEDDEDVVYEVELDDEMSESMDMEEDYDFEKVHESKMTIKPKGKGMGKSKFSYKKTTGGFKEDMKQGTRGVGMGKGPKKFEYKEGKKMETKESSRTLGIGRSVGKKGLPKKRTAPRHLHTENVIPNENLINQVQVLREKNEEYRKALNIFRQKLNEVAVFNSNLAYATRLFTEHSTSKQEKINILRRFDGVESIKESKSLYKTLKDELSGKQGNVVTESIEKVIDREPQSGSAINLIESKTYENPQFLRMKDLMSKLTK
jgi:hypothetical protein